MKSEVDNVLTIGDLHKMPHWKVYVGNSAKGPVYCSSDSIIAEATSITWDSSKIVLESYLSRALPGTYLIHYKTSADEKLKIYSLTFQITAATGDAAIAGQQGLQNQIPFNFMQTMMSQQFDAQIGKVTEKFQWQLEKMELQRKLEDMEKKMKERKEKNPAFDWTKVPDVIDNAIAAWTKVKALKNNAAPQIAIGTSSNNIPADAATKGEEEEEEEGFTGFHLKDDKHVEIYVSTMDEMIARNGGDHNETVIELYCLNELRKEKAEMFDAFVLPELKKYKAALYAKMGITTG